MMAKKQNAKIKLSGRIAYLLAIIGLLVLLSGALALALYAEHAQPPQKIVSVSLGSMQYKIVGGKAVKRTDATVASLKDFLSAAGKEDLRLGCTSSYYNVVRTTTDESQILLHYGCAYPSASMYIIRNGTSWRFISPTNQFDDLGVPVCAYLSQHGISPEIAPVCITAWPSMHETYMIR